MTSDLCPPGALYVCTEDPFPIRRLQQLISEQTSLRSDVPLSLIGRLRFSDNIYVEHAADLVRDLCPQIGRSLWLTVGSQVC